MKNLLKKLKLWRQRHMLTTTEAHAMCQAAEQIALETGKELAARDLQGERDKVVRLFHGLTSIKMDVNSRTQVMEIRLVLDRRTLRLLDVTDAARLLAQRTEAIYIEQLNKRMKEESK